jgi:hypothetical protein
MPTSTIDPTREEVTVTTSTDTVAVPHPITAGPAMAALHRFFRDCTWNGTIVEGEWDRAHPR